MVFRNCGNFQDSGMSCYVIPFVHIQEWSFNLKVWAPSPKINTQTVADNTPLRTPHAPTYQMCSGYYVKLSANCAKPLCLFEDVIHCCVMNGRWITGGNGMGPPPSSSSSTSRPIIIYLWTNHHPPMDRLSWTEWPIISLFTVTSIITAF